MGGAGTPVLVPMAMGLSLLWHCRGSQASREQWGAQVSMALRWVCTVVPPLLFGVLQPLHSPHPIPLLLSPQGEMGPPGSPGPRGPQVRGYVTAPEDLGCLGTDWGVS